MIVALSGHCSTTHSGAAIPCSLRIGAMVFSTHPTGQPHGRWGTSESWPLRI
jgi:hypothetical protein